MHFSWRCGLSAHFNRVPFVLLFARPIMAKVIDATTFPFLFQATSRQKQRAKPILIPITRHRSHYWFHFHRISLHFIGFHWISLHFIVTESLKCSWNRKESQPKPKNLKECSKNHQECPRILSNRKILQGILRQLKINFERKEQKSKRAMRILESPPIS